MNYLEWVDVVLRRVIAGKAASDIYGVAQLSADLGLEGDGEAAQAIHDALSDLDEIGMLEVASSGFDVRFTQNTRMLRDGDQLESAWPSIVKAYLDNQQLEFLRALCEVSIEDRERYAYARHVHVREVFEHLGWPTEEIQPFYDLTKSLREARCVHHWRWPPAGRSFCGRPTSGSFEPRRRRPRPTRS